MILTETAAIPPGVLPLDALKEQLRLVLGLADDGAEDGE